MTKISLEKKVGRTTSSCFANKIIKLTLIRSWQDTQEVLAKSLIYNIFYVILKYIINFKNKTKKIT